MFHPDFEKTMEAVIGWPVEAVMDVLSAKFRELGLDGETTENGEILLENIQRRPVSNKQYQEGLLAGYRQRRANGGRLDPSERKQELNAWLSVNGRSRGG